MCLIDKTETDLTKQTNFQNKLFMNDIEIKKTNEKKQIEDQSANNIYYCMTHYVPLKQD